ncbi:hypothetical protein N7478_000267 [Penicillium angulare]|uniref:uncharacterized protein n=1 Tax=Penicillium angulare TaxID=116970 RepID=UPI0025420431|nr:uncharacterized protein N7478_000267 [Penicillium angulare]KAJ5291016.1 hypothetical protein N7478_000267 [Penicillium angulare]
MFVENSEPDSLTSGLAENCGFDTLPREMMGTSNVCSFPLELWQTSRQSELDMHTPDMQLALEPYTSAVSPSQTRPCKCDEDVSNIVRSLNGANMGHDVILTIRTGVTLSERLLTCPICYDVSKPPRLTVQNVLLIGHLMLEVTSGYRKYIHWLDKNATGDDSRNDTETVYLDSGLGFPSELNLQISSEKLRDLVMDGLQMDVQRLLRMGERFAERQRHRHMVGHTTCPDAEGRCRRREYGIDHDPLDVCPHNPVARKLIPCFRIVDEVREMIQQVADTLN